MAMAGEGRGPLAGLRVVEVEQMIAGPFCGHIFADYGAEVDSQAGTPPKVHFGKLRNPAGGRVRAMLKIDGAASQSVASYAARGPGA